MKKIMVIISAMLMMTFTAFADDSSDILQAFDKYVKAANTYSKTLPSFYTSDAKIKRVVNRKQGGQRIVTIPFDRYLKELDSHSILAKTVHYTNRYEDRKVKKVNGEYRVMATRIPRNDKLGLPCYFVYTKVNGKWKIKEESMTTNVQTFLNAK